MIDARYGHTASAVRRDLHRIPEIGFSEFKTQKYIMDYLKNLGLSPKPAAKTGVVCYLDFGRSETAAFRSDIDALPIQEAADSDYKSQHPGMMHACGHDGHMSMLLTFAEVLVTEKLTPQANVLLIFQPAEEGPGGAEHIVSEGILEEYNVNRIYAYHLYPGAEYAKTSVKSGEFFASSTELYIDIKGVPSHGAQPQDGRDALLACANLIIQLNTISAKSVNPLEDSVLCIGKMHAGDRLNITAGHAAAEGTLRTFNENVKKRVIERIYEICRGISESFGVEAEFRPVYLYPAVINDSSLYEDAKAKLAENAAEAEKVMLAEDFSYYALKVPALYMLLGTDDGNEEHQYPLHSDRFAFDDSVLLTGVESYLKLII